MGLKLRRNMPRPEQGDPVSFRASALWQAGDSGFLLARERSTGLWRAFSLVDPHDPLGRDRLRLATNRFRTRREALEVIEALGFGED